MGMGAVPPILVVGCGKMGGALLGGWLDRGLDPSGVHVVEPNPAIAAQLEREHPVRVHDGPDRLPAGLRPGVVVLAVKPQMMDGVAPAYRRFAGDAVFLSIAAGKTLGAFQSLLGGEAAIVRSMPNTPAAVRRGISVLVANAAATREQRHLCENLLSAVGDTAWVADEALMDAVTAVSGSGPAYVFLLAECLAEAGARAGLPADLAARLARATVAGAGELLHRSSETASQLRINVTSPGGTTAAALAVLMAETGGMKGLLDEAVAAATERSRQLAG